MSTAALQANLDQSFDRLLAAHDEAALALAHAKSGDPAIIAGYCGTSAALDDAIARFALAYARQTEQDYDALAKARRGAHPGCD